MFVLLVCALLNPTTLSLSLFRHVQLVHSHWVCTFFFEIRIFPLVLTNITIKWFHFISPLLLEFAFPNEFSNCLRGRKVKLVVFVWIFFTVCFCWPPPPLQCSSPKSFSIPPPLSHSSDKMCTGGKVVLVGDISPATYDCHHHHQHHCCHHYHYQLSMTVIINHQIFPITLLVEEVVLVLRERYCPPLMTHKIWPS